MITRIMTRTVRSPPLALPSPYPGIHSAHGLPTAHRRGDTDTESEQDVYNRNYAPSAESLNPNFRSGVSDISNTYEYGGPGVREPYPAWTSERQIPLSKEYVLSCFYWPFSSST